MNVNVSGGAGGWMLEAGSSCSDSEAPFRNLKYFLVGAVVQLVQKHPAPDWLPPNAGSLLLSPERTCG